MEKEKGKKNKKTVWIVIGTIVLILCCVGGILYKYYHDQIGKFTTEMNAISSLDMTNSAEQAELDVYLNRIVCEGEFGKIEKDTKKYLIDIETDTLDILKMFNDSKMDNLITIDNIKKDGPSFTSSNQYITETLNTLNDKKSSLNDHLNMDTLMSYYNDVNPFIYSILKSELTSELEETLNNSKKEINDGTDMYSSYLTICQNTLKFLTDNKDDWEVIGGTIYFQTQDEIDTYNNFITQIQNISVGNSNESA